MTGLHRRSDTDLVDRGLSVLFRYADHWKKQYRSFGFTALFYYAMIWVNQEYENYHRYDKPEGSAVKVVEMDQDEKGGWLDRLIFFYQNGE